MHAPAWRTRRPETHDLHEGTHPAVIVISHALIGRGIHLTGVPSSEACLGRSDLGELNPRPAPMTFSYRSCSAYMNSPDRQGGCGCFWSVGACFVRHGGSFPAWPRGKTGWPAGQRVPTAAGLRAAGRHAYRCDSAGSGVQARRLAGLLRPTVRRQRPQRPRPPHLRPHHAGPAVTRAMTR